MSCREGDHLKLSCAAYGEPRPMVSWNRVDGNAIPKGSWSGKLHHNLTFILTFSWRPLNLWYSLPVANEIGSILNITQISRKHMGEYVCKANNGIPPIAKQTFNVQVHCKQIYYASLPNLLFFENISFISSRQSRLWFGSTLRWLAVTMVLLR